MCPSRVLPNPDIPSPFDNVEADGNNPRGDALTDAKADITTSVTAFTGASVGPQPFANASADAYPQLKCELRANGQAAMEQKIKLFDPGNIKPNRNVVRPLSEGLKYVASKAETGISIGKFAIDQIQSHPALVAALGAAVVLTIHAGPIAWAVLGVSLAVVSLAKNLSAADRSLSHFANLSKILDLAKRQPSDQRDRELKPQSVRDHELMIDQVLPYIIRQKEIKAARRLARAAPVASQAESAYTVGRWFYKAESGMTRGQHAEILARHCIACNCTVSALIVAELFGIDDAEVLLASSDISEVRDTLVTKMASQ